MTSSLGSLDPSPLAQEMQCCHDQTCNVSTTQGVVEKVLMLNLLLTGQMSPFRATSVIGTTLQLIGVRTLSGVAPDHAAALLVPLVLPLAIGAFLGTINLAARANLSAASQFRRGYAVSPPVTRVIAVLLVLAGAIHLALVPGHFVEDRGLAILFLLNGATFLFLGIGTSIWKRWRSAAAMLLAATLVAYSFFIGGGREEFDLVGASAFLIELVALALVWRASPSSTDSFAGR